GSSLGIGSALATVPLARYVSQNGRRAGLTAAWTIAALGAVIILAGTIAEFYPLLPLGGTLLGVASAANYSARYAAADLADDAERAKAIGTLMWAITVGAVLGPTLALGIAADFAELIGLPSLAGPYLLAIALFAVAIAVIHKHLRPDPLEISGHLGDSASTPELKPAIHSIANSAPARLATSAMVASHFVMVSVMSMTPLHMKDGSQALQVIGFVISLHVLGMYGFAPFIGRIVDRVGPRIVIATGGVVLFAGAELVSRTAAADRTGLFVGLFAIGLGWSLGIISASSLLTGTFTGHERVMVQGAADFAMTATGATAGFAAGFVMQQWGFASLSRYVALAGLALTLYAMSSYLRKDRSAPLKVPA
ncbi:MAG: MFS transporter, partial [Acidimicrobiales bacterium]